jgi:hypothetical protein
MTGRIEEAETVLQVGIYQNIFSAINLLSTYAMLGFDSADKFNNIVNRTLSLVDSFGIKNLQPVLIISFYVLAAQGHLSFERSEKALDLLEQYTELAESGISWRLEGDSFFNLIGDWLSDAGLVSPIAVISNLLKSGHI